ncbi:MAG: choice-of-anchor L domain-containing protein [Flavobacteriales bacterium]|nr:choice-of-anchor L domain-containing protein [Flavobacteriales bacterium]MDG1780908.1 choice-of-anchor L domain-containing protein [Flavobacteriales bacterium]MDG2245816.1 choice-of-anchor L domain-containing protein [Flavobacteriales bacterium]
MASIKHLLTFTFCIFFVVSSSAQLQVDTEISTEQLVQDFLLGSGILIENVTVQGADVQTGMFSFAPESVGMESGIVMSTASASNLMAPGSFDDVPFGEGVAGDEDLIMISNLVPVYIGESFNILSANDMCVIEFDFIPLADSLAFNYVFGSNEYEAWVNTAFNDMFAFFLSGPTISGPYSAPAAFPNGAANIAFVPGTDPELPITVSSVNSSLNDEFYIPNEGQDDIAINGYTTVLTASASGLNVGETYHIRLAIADGTDTALESVVLLEEGSFSAYETIEEAFGPGDLDGDSDIDIDDLLDLLGDLGCEGVDCIGDLNGDGITNVMDVLFFLGLFE